MEWMVGLRSDGVKGLTDWMSHLILKFRRGQPCGSWRDACKLELVDVVFLAAPHTPSVYPHTSFHFIVLLSSWFLELLLQNRHRVKWYNSVSRYLLAKTISVRRYLNVIPWRYTLTSYFIIKNYTHRGCTLVSLTCIKQDGMLP